MGKKRYTPKRGWKEPARERLRSTQRQPESQTKEEPDTKSQADHPAHDWRDVVKATFGDLHKWSWLQNVVVGAAFLLLGPAVGLFVSSTKLALGSLALGIIIIFGIFAITLIVRSRGHEEPTPPLSAALPPAPSPSPTLTAEEPAKDISQPHEGLPGFSLYMVIRLIAGPAKGRRYILDYGSKENERLSVYISQDHIFTFSFVDAKGEPHPVQVPLGRKGVPIGVWCIVYCGVGIAGEYTSLKVEVNRRIVGEAKLRFRADIGALDIPGGVIGADLAGEHCGVFDLGVLTYAFKTFSREVYIPLETYFRATGPKSHLAFRASQWLRASDPRVNTS